MKQPNPAIVAQAAVRRLPRWALWGLTLVYALAGFWGRDPWRSADMTTLGVIQALIQRHSDWWHPALPGAAIDNAVLLPYWVGAWFLQHTPVGWDLAGFVRLPFIVLLGLAFACTWYGCYYLARHPQAQPVAFAFGGEAKPNDFARALADGALLALMASLGLAQIGHETTPALFQLGGVSLLFYGLSSRPYHPVVAHTALAVGSAVLALSGAPLMAVAYLAAELVIPRHLPTEEWPHRHVRRWGVLPYVAMVLLLSTALDLWRWRMEAPNLHWGGISGTAQLLVWFTWPAWPLALWGVWRWRKHVLSREFPRHMALPLWFVVVSVLCMLFNPDPDRTLFLALPSMAALAAFALPTLKRQVSALVDWFTLVFFSACGFTIWVVWLALQTGFPAQPAANVARLAPGFEHRFLIPALIVAILATLAWVYLVQWRVGRHRAAIWKSLVLPATGAVLCWTLLMSLWLPLLDYAQSYRVWAQRIVIAASSPLTCLRTQGLDAAHSAALHWYMPEVMSRGESQCNWLLVEAEPGAPSPRGIDWDQWRVRQLVQHPVGNADDVWLLERRR
ncbi:hypothetical protein KIK84_00175 [Curvibacter sp. CHRR-16]|uniref:hypothetical protein n=1 Tax=Curvibacter sp. CHRR-16 TaxID=2835872 RepID=UPI001BD93B28|nr:hypothetical protein [Curvibacter sp. CHRR-16]